MGRFRSRPGSGSLEHSSPTIKPSATPGAFLLPKNNGPGGEVVPPGPLLEEWSRCILRVGVILQVMNEAGPEFPNIGLDLADILPETVQLGDHDLVAVGLPVLPARD